MSNKTDIPWSHKADDLNKINQWPSRDDMSVLEQHTFEVDAIRHPITGMILEQGVGALPVSVQAQHHCRQIEAEQGKDAADAMRRKLAGQPLKAVG